LINKDTIQNIIETARIEEVIGDYVTLKKRGVNLLGICPFHTEKTPSFTVSPAKGIYKCFGCGKAGNSVNFLMEHEHLSYPEALRQLAKKYFIEIQEELESPEQMLAEGEKESLMHATAFAQQFFSKTLLETDEGKAIGLSYFKERGFDERVIEKFQLGYSPEEWNGFTKTALENGFKLDYLVTTGLTISKEDQHYDRFRGRVMFPVHNVSGRVIAFGGRTLSTDKTKPKYVNSPESEIYHKSNVLYGIYFAKSSIISNDNCFLVEGYTDVISMHLAGVENVVASSGTSLTVDQIKLIRRYTPNITILYDGDAAGIKASFRGIDMILEEGMNVKIVLFPDGEDPDSYARKHRPAEVRDFIHDNAVDFIIFKTKLLSKEAGNDLVKRSGMIKEISNSIALVPSGSLRQEYTKELSEKANIEERILINEINKILSTKAKYKSEKIASEQEQPEISDFTSEPQYEILEENTVSQEKELLRFMLNYGTKEIEVEVVDEDDEKTKIKMQLASFIVMELQRDKIDFQNPVYQLILNEYVKLLDEDTIPNVQNFVNHSDHQISAAMPELLVNPYDLSGNWKKMHKINVPLEDEKLKESAISYVYSLKLKKVDKMIAENLDALKKAKNEEDEIILMGKHNALMEAKRDFAEKLTRIITR